jgi:hypothetical protein
MDYHLRQRRIQESLEEGNGSNSPSFDDHQNKAKISKKKYNINPIVKYIYQSLN